MQREGATIIEIPVNHDGDLDLDRLTSSLSDDTALFTTMWANNETGVIFPVREIGQICRGAAYRFIAMPRRPSESCRSI